MTTRNLKELEDMELLDGQVLASHIKMRELCTTGVIIDVNETNQLPQHDYFEDDMDSMNDGPNSNDFDPNANLYNTPGLNSFAVIGATMNNLYENGMIKKRVAREGFGNIVTDRSEVHIHYNIFWEYENAAFDSTYMRGQEKVFHLDNSEVLPGMEIAVKSMKIGEESHFIISYKLLFGVTGCPPRIKPKADAFFTIELMSETIESSCFPKTLHANESKQFSDLILLIKSNHISGVENFKRSNMKSAEKYFHKAVSMLKIAHLKDEDEQKQQQALLIKMYTNLAIVYNKLHLPAKACMMCNEIAHITNINLHSKVLFQQGKALIELREYAQAQRSFLKAAKLNPHNEDIGNMLLSIESDVALCKNQELEICCKMFGQKVPKKNEIQTLSDEFRNEISKLVKQFMSIETKQRLQLPKILNVIEIQCFKDVGSEFNLQLEVEGNSRYFLVKPNTK